MDPREYIFLRIILYIWYVQLAVDHAMNASMHLLIISHRFTGTFWLVQGTSLMPSFAVGTMYSPDGNTLEGMQTAEYSATVGELYLSQFIIYARKC